MKKDFEQPVLEVVALGDGDVIVTSPNTTESFDTEFDTNIIGSNW